jgi:Spy/CpxP family protein refolding chaperone
VLNRSKLWAAGLLAAAFAAGVAVGGAAQAALADRDNGRARDRGRRISYAERLERDLQLSPEQRDSVENIMARNQQAIREIWRQADRQVHTLRLRIRNEILPLLDDRQREAFQRINARHDSLHAARERGRSPR